MNALGIITSSGFCAIICRVRPRVSVLFAGSSYYAHVCIWKVHSIPPTVGHARSGKFADVSWKRYREGHSHTVEKTCCMCGGFGLNRRCTESTLSQQNERLWSCWPPGTNTWVRICIRPSCGCRRGKTLLFTHLFMNQPACFNQRQRCVLFRVSHHRWCPYGCNVKAVWLREPSSFIFMITTLFKNIGTVRLSVKS